jgi:hypothetical protein
MKMLNQIICSSIAVAAALALSASTAQAQNLLVNGSFENAGGFTANPITLSGVNQGWALFDGRSAQSDMFYSTDYPQDGSYALLEQNGAGNGWNPAGAYQIVTATAGTSYTASIYALTDTGMQGDWWTTPVDFQLGFLDSSLVNIVTFDPGWASVTQDAWQQYTITGTAPAGTAFAVIYAMNMVSGSNTGTVNVYFDNAVLVPEPSTLALLSLGLAVPFYFRRRKNA